MTEIIIGTTPTITYKYKIVSPSEFRTAFLTIKVGGQIILEKTLADAEIGDDSLAWTLSQAETLAIGTRSGKMQANAVTQDGKRVTSTEESIRGLPNQKAEVI